MTSSSLFWLRFQDLLIARLCPTRSHQGIHQSGKVGSFQRMFQGTWHDQKSEQYQGLPEGAAVFPHCDSTVGALDGCWKLSAFKGTVFPVVFPVNGHVIAIIVIRLALCRVRWVGLLLQHELTGVLRLVLCRVWWGPQFDPWSSSPVSWLVHEKQGYKI